MNRSRSVLVDTGAWLAAFHRRDLYHGEAARELRRLREARTPLVVTELILAETHLHLLHALGPIRAVDHLSTLKGDPAIDEVHTTTVLQQSAVSEWIRRFSDPRRSTWVTSRPHSEAAKPPRVAA